MKKAIVIKEFCDEYEYDNIFQDNYSGRYMYGRQCVGIVCTNPLKTLVELCDYIKGIDDIESIKDFLGDVQYDNMGLKTILYFTGIKPLNSEF